MKRSTPTVVGVDTGGTFTDFVALVSGRLVTLKEPSTPEAPERAVLAGLARLSVGRGTRVRHGSTVATNALLERKGAQVVLLTTAGFEDVLEIGRQDRPDLYALTPHRTPPLVPRERRIGVDERLGAAGETLRALTAAAIRRAVARARAARPGTIAVGLLHAYAHPRHERRLARALRALGVPVTLSSELCPEIREVERLTTTVVNAYLRPRVGQYLAGLERALGRRLEIVLSHGGTAPSARAALEPVRQLLSGPAAGLEAAFAAARACGFERALTLDVGGTSTDCAYADGELPRQRAREVAGFPIQLPLLDVHTVGAGGGSIARVDAGGLLQVGPESAGADPGPAAYGRGGPATVTDALIVLGRLPVRELAGGAVRIDASHAEQVLARLAKRAGLRSARAAAAAVVTLADARMEAALRRVSVERGHDPRGAALVAFGGAGGLHAVALAESLACSAVVFPAAAGVLSALGALAGSPRREKSRSVLLPATDREALARALAALDADVRREFAAAERPRVTLRRFAEMRYVGQAHELTVPLERDPIAAFHVEHERRYGFADRARAVEVVTVEVRGALPAPALPAPAAASRAAPRAGVAPVWHAGRLVRAACWNAEQLPRHFAARGPALLLQSSATQWVPPGWRVRRHASGALLATRGGAR